MNPLANIHPKVRSGLYLIYGIVGLVLGGLEVADVERIFNTDVTRILAVFAYVGTALGFTALSNMPSAVDVVEGDAPMPPDHERGAGEVEFLVKVIGLVIIVALAVWLLRALF